MIPFPKQAPKTRFSLLQNPFHFVGGVLVSASSEGRHSLLDLVSGILIPKISRVQGTQLAVIPFPYGYVLSTVLGKRWVVLLGGLLDGDAGMSQLIE